MSNKPNILFLDIETKPTKAYVWRMWDENIHPNQIIEDGGLLCIGAKWQGSKEKLFWSEWDHGHDNMVNEAHKLLTAADAVVTYNGDKFDLPKLQGEFILSGLLPPPPWTSIDCLKTVRQMGFSMNRLAYIGPLLKVGQKIKHEGFSLWYDVMQGDQKAKDKMERYCLQDVVLLERLYKKIRPFIKNHPHLSEIGAGGCGACGSYKLQRRGFRRTKAYRIQRLQCQACGSWQDGKRQKLT